jgi:hypothetical protein
MSKLSTDAFELDKIYPTVTPDEEYRIVHEGAAAVDEILGSKRSKTDTDSKTKTATTGLGTTTATASVAATAMTTDVVKKSSPPASEDSFYEDEEDTVTNFSGFSDVADMSEEDFFKKVESGNF